MKSTSTPLVLSPEDIILLESWTRKSTISHGLAQRARVILLVYQGYKDPQIAHTVGLSRQSVIKWRQRYAQKGAEGLKDAPRPGKPRTYSDEDRRKVLLTLGRPSEGSTHWSIRALAQATGVGRETVHRILQAERLKPHLTKSWVHSTDPEFQTKALDVIGLYLDPPENALVLCVDEKTCIQALNRTEPVLPLKPGLPERRSFDYVRHGTTNLYAALAVHQGEVTGQCQDRHRHQEFLGFLKLLWRKYKDQEIHLIVDNLSAHKHKNVKNWLRKHPRVKLHFTPTHSSWLNQVEIWFSILSRRAILRGSFRSVKELIHTIMAFIENYNQRGQTFSWTFNKEALIRKLNNVTKH